MQPATVLYHRLCGQDSLRQAADPQTAGVSGGDTSKGYLWRLWHMSGKYQTHLVLFQPHLELAAICPAVDCGPTIGQNLASWALCAGALLWTRLPDPSCAKQTDLQSPLDRSIYTPVVAGILQWTLDAEPRCFNHAFSTESFLPDGGRLVPCIFTDYDIPGSAGMPKCMWLKWHLNATIG